MTNEQKGGTPTEEPEKKIVCNNLNLLLGTRGSEQAASTYWNIDVKNELLHHFKVQMSYLGMTRDFTWSSSSRPNNKRADYLN